MTTAACYHCGRLMGSLHRATCTVGPGRGVNKFDVPRESLPRDMQARVGLAIALGVYPEHIAPWQVS